MCKEYLFSRVFAATILAGGATQPVSVQAQEAKAGLEVVVVTARRREESIQEVPVAVTALGSEQLFEGGVRQLADLRMKAPALIISQSPGGSAIPAFTIRSQRQNEGVLTQDLSVAVYQDEVVQARPHGLNQAFFDVASVQVLKGPQGTLFGRNSTGGAILIQPNHPTERFEAEVALGAGSFERRNAQAMLNIPFSDTVFFRIAGDRTKDDGFSVNIRDGRRHNDVNSEAARASLTWKPGERFETYTTAQYVHTDDGGSIQTPIYAYPVNFAALPSTEGLYNFLFNGVNPNPGCMAFLGGANPGGLCNYDTPVYANEVAAQSGRDLYHVVSNIDPFSTVERRSITNITTAQLGAVTIKNVAGYADLDYNAKIDWDGSIIGGLYSEYFNDIEQISEEFQLLGTAFGDKLDWIAGLYYFNEKGTDITESGALDVFPANVTNPFFSGGSMENTGYSAFAQGTWKLDSVHQGLSATTGIRYTIDKREMALDHTNALGCRLVDRNGVQLSPCFKAVDETFREPTWTLGLEQQLGDDMLIYLAHRRGYRAGGFNNRAEEPAQFAPFRPEIVDDLEFGAKADWRFGDAYARTNIAVFYQRYKDIQRTLSFTSRSGNIGSNIANAAKAKIYGGEFEATFMPVESLEFSLFYAMSIARYDEFIDPIQGDLSNYKLIGSPDHTGGATVRYTLPLPSTAGQLALQAADYYISSSYQFADQNHPLSQEDGCAGVPRGLGECARITAGCGGLRQECPGRGVFRFRGEHPIAGLDHRLRGTAAHVRCRAALSVRLMDVAGSFLPGDPCEQQFRRQWSVSGALLPGRLRHSRSRPGGADVSAALWHRVISVHA